MFRDICLLTFTEVYVNFIFIKIIVKQIVSDNEKTLFRSETPANNNEQYTKGREKRRGGKL